MKDNLKKLKKSMSKDLKDDFIFLDVDDDISDVEYFISTGCTALDYTIANKRDGGIPVGKITTLSGQSSSGKSLMAIHACANAQKMGGLAIYLDAEHGFNDDFARRVGLDIEGDGFWLENPTSVESVFEFVFSLCHNIDEMKKNGEFTYKFVLIVWDSVAATACKADLEAENPDPTSSIGLKPRIISKNFSLLTQKAARKDIAFLCLNQLRSRIGGMPGQDPWVEPGGNALIFYPSVRVRLSSVGKKKDRDGNIIGVETQSQVLKTRFGPPFRKAEFPIYFTHGIDDADSVLSMLEEMKGIQSLSGGQKGTLLAFNGEPRELAIRKADFKSRYMNDEVFRDKVLGALDAVMKKDMGDPRLQEIETVKETE